jgi:hypothetical protein
MPDFTKLLLNLGGGDCINTSNVITVIAILGSGKEGNLELNRQHSLTTVNRTVLILYTLIICLAARLRSSVRAVQHVPVVLVPVLYNTKHFCTKHFEVQWTVRGLEDTVGHLGTHFPG